MEIVRDDDASPRDVVTLINLGETLGKIPIVTKSPVGRRMLSSTILEALKLVDEGTLIAFSRKYNSFDCLISACSIYRS
jgi:3-hydroxyacyl-CoA dehydrogenase